MKNKDLLQRASVLLICLLQTCFCWAQQIRVSGVVKDEAGDPLIGVNVVELGTRNGTTTDLDGKYVLEVDKKGKLTFSYIGYLKLEEAVNGRTVINAKLISDTRQIEEVVVVGYGVQKKETLTGAVAQIKADKITTTKSPSLVSGLQGKVPGLMIRQQTGEPGAYNSLVSIRGFGSPLVVIDGVARKNMSDFERLNPEDIESISVLKDASAAIYGMNADNGVIIVTTKKGQEGRSQVNYSGFVGFQSPTSSWDMADAYTYRVIKNEMDRNIGNAPTYSAEELEKWRLGKERGYQDNDWMDIMLKDRTFQQQHNLSISGGGKKVKYYMGGGFLQNDGLLRSDIQHYKKYNFNANFTAELFKDLKAEVVFGITSDNTKSPQGGYFWLFKPIITADRGVGPFTIDDPDKLAFIPGPGNNNPYALMSEEVRGYDKNKSSQYQTTVSLTYSLPWVKGLNLKVLGAYDASYTDWSNLMKDYYLYDYMNSDKVVKSPNPAAIYKNSTTQYNMLDFQFQAYYNNTFNGKHTVGGMLLYEIKENNTRFLSASRQWDDIFTNDLINQGSEGGANYKNDGWRSQQRFLSFLGRFNYDYKGRYLAEFLFRNDGSYRYAPGNRWSFFPAFSAGWRISEEAFMKNALPVISNLKLRASCGWMGADAGNPFQFYPGYTMSGIQGGYVFDNDVLTKGMIPQGVINNNLSWIKTRTVDIGIDASLWNGKLNIVADIFQKDREGLLATRAQSVPNTFGASFPQENLNSDRYKGIELEVSHMNQVGDFFYNISANMTYARKYLVHQERAPYNSSMEAWKDKWGSNRVLGREWGYSYNGVYTNIRDYETAPLIGGSNGNSKGLPGSVRITDVNGDGKIDGNDQMPDFWAGQYQGYATNPPLQYGLNMSGGWKGLDLNVLLQGSALFTVFHKVDDVWGYGRNPTLWEKYLDRWHTADPEADPYDPNTQWISGKYPALRGNTNGTTDALTTDRWRVNASYLRIKSVELGYTLPTALTKKAKIEKVRFYVNGFNLYTFCGKDVKGLDPEREEGSYAADLTYPLMRSFNFGVNINF